MSNFWGKAPSSKPNIYQVLSYGGNATSVPSTNFGPQTYQVRVISEVQGWIVFGVGSTGGTTLSCTAQSGSAKINANADEEYWTVQPGMMCAFNSTSTSSGMVSITEMA
jgi:hypothetical protein